MLFVLNRCYLLIFFQYAFMGFSQRHRKLFEWADIMKSYFGKRICWVCNVKDGCNQQGERLKTKDTLFEGSRIPLTDNDLFIAGERS